MIRVRSCMVLGVMASALLPTIVFAQQVPTCSAAQEAAARSAVRTWRQAKYDEFRSRLVNADMASSTPASDPFAITGGFNDDKTTAKLQVSKGFRGAATVTLGGSLTSPGAKNIDLFDPLKAATDYSAKIGFGWSYWKNVLPENKVRARMCGAAEMTTAGMTEMRTELAADEGPKKPFVFGVAYEGGRSTFVFADAANGYKEASERHRAQTLNVTGGYVHVHASTTVKDRSITTILATYQRRWAHAAGSDETQIYCHPVDNSTATSCGTTPLPNVAPVSKPSHLVQLDVRHFLKWPIAPGFRFTRNVTAGFSTTEAPVYFISKDATDGRFSFTGGITGGYRDGGPAKGRFVALFFGAAARPVEKK